MDVAEALTLHGPALMRYARTVARDSHEAADLYQQTWLRALEHREQVEGFPRERMEPWLIRVMNNALVDIRRREKRAYPVEDMEEQGYEADFSRVETEQMLEALPPNLRQAVRMRHFEGMSSVEIGRALGVPAATVRTRLRAAAILLKKQWKDGEAI